MKDTCKYSKSWPLEVEETFASLVF